MRSSVTRRANAGLDSAALERLLFASFSLPSAALSAAFPWPSSSMLLAPQQPLAPPFYFAAALCIGLHHATSVKLSEATVIFIGIFVAWAAAYNAAFSGISFFDSPDRWLPSQFGPQAAFIKAYHVVLSGVVAGAIGGLGTSVSVAVIRKTARNRGFFIRTIVIAAACGWAASGAQLPSARRAPGSVPCLAARSGLVRCKGSSRVARGGTRRTGNSARNALDVSRDEAH